MPEVVSRASWVARAPRSRVSLPGSQGNTIHYEGGALGNYDHSKCPGMVRSIQNYHMDTMGWADIAYSTITCRHGTIYDCRGYGIRTAAQGTQTGNDISHAHCAMIGNGDSVPEELKDALRWIVEQYRQKGSGDKLWAHCDWHSTGCCGPVLIPWTHNGMPDEIPPMPSPEEIIVKLNAPQVTILNHLDWDGYLQVCADGGVFQQGNPPFYGSLGNLKLNSPIVDADVMPDGKGYILVGADGGIFNFGSAPFEGSLGGTHLNKPIVSISITKTGQGYLIGAQDGGVFAEGDAVFKGAGQYQG